MYGRKKNDEQRKEKRGERGLKGGGETKEWGKGDRVLANPHLHTQDRARFFKVEEDGGGAKGVKKTQSGERGKVVVGNSTISMHGSCTLV